MSSVKHYVPGDAERELTLTRVFDAPRPLVFKAWTDPKLVARWWGPKMFTNPVCEVDARPGGKLHIVMHGPDGNDYPMRGVFQEVVAPEKLSFSSFAVDAENKPVLDVLTTILFAEEGKKTRLTLIARGKALTPIAIQYLQGMEQGWSESLEKLMELLPRL